jgi:IMP dehydrogenase/GMP reductase
MAHIYDEPSRTFGEYLLVPNLTRKGIVPSAVDLTAPLVRFPRGSAAPLSIKVPITSAMMQAVSDDKLAIALGGGSICITREQKGTGRGQATAVIEAARAREEYCQRTGTYVPICSDGGITRDSHITLALAMGADFVMMGRYFAGFEEAPGRKLRLDHTIVKEYWGEGSNRARNWQRYDDGSGNKSGLAFEEGWTPMSRTPARSRTISTERWPNCARPCATAAP